MNKQLKFLLEDQQLKFLLENNQDWKLITVETYHNGEWESTKSHWHRDGCEICADVEEEARKESLLLT